MAHIRYSHSGLPRKASRKPRTSPRKEPSQRRAHATVGAILEATAHILSRAGYEGLSTNEVALAAGVSIGSLYQYFPNKQALVSALIERHAEAMADVVMRHAVDTEGSLETNIARFVEAMLAAHQIDPALHRVLLEHRPQLGPQDALQRLDALSLGMIQAYLERHSARLRKQDLGVAAYVLYCAVEGAIHTAAKDRPELLADGRLHEELVDLILRYLCLTARRSNRSRKQGV